MLREKRLGYSKDNLTNTVAAPNYLEELEKRVSTTSDLQTLADFFDFCRMLREKLIV